MRLPPWDPQHPFHVSYSYKARSIVLTIAAPTSWARLLIHTLETLTLLGVALRSHADAAARSQRTDDLATARAARCADVYAAYLALRSSGLLHRAAIRALSDDPAFADLRWVPADFNWCVRTLRPAPGADGQDRLRLRSPAGSPSSLLGGAQPARCRG